MSYDPELDLESDVTEAELLDMESEFVEDDEPDPFHGNDAAADADVLASAGWGTDEDYGGYDDYGDW